MSTASDMLVILMKEGLHSSAEILLNFIRCSSNVEGSEVSNPSSSSLSYLLWSANCLFEQQEYYRAAGYYIRVEEHLAFDSLSQQTIWSVIFRLGQCYEKMNQPAKVIQYLLKIPKSFRNSQMEMILAKAYERLGKRSDAIAAYKAVLTKTNFAFEAMIRLVHLGEKPKEILRLCAAGSQKSFISLAIIPWIESLLQAHESMGKQTFLPASVTFSKLEEKYPNNLHLLEYQARCKVFADDLQDARNCFEKILIQEDGYASSMDTYASVLKKLNDVPALKKVSHQLMSVAPHKGETWSAVSLVHNLKHPKHLKTTFALIDKAIRLNPLYWFGFVQKGWLYLRQGVHEEAVRCFRSALHIESNVFCFTGLVKAKLSCEQLQEAACLANECFKQFPDSPIALTLLGTCLSRFPNWQEKALNIFWQALKVDKYCIDAIAGVTEILVDQKKYPETIEVLQKQLEFGRHRDLLHTRLAEVYHLDNNHGKALEHYNSALSVNPNLEVAKDGLTLLSKEVFGDHAKDDLDEEEGEDDGDFDDDDGQDDLFGGDLGSGVLSGGEFGSDGDLDLSFY